MGTIRECIRKDGSKSYHAEVRLKGSPPERETFRTRSLAKQWVQNIEVPYAMAGILKRPSLKNILLLT